MLLPFYNVGIMLIETNTRNTVHLADKRFARNQQGHIQPLLKGFLHRKLTFDML